MVLVDTTELEAEHVDALKKFLEERGVEFEEESVGLDIKIDGRRKLKFLLKKFLHKNGLKEDYKVISVRTASFDGFIVKRRKRA